MKGWVGSLEKILFCGTGKILRSKLSGVFHSHGNRENRDLSLKKGAFLALTIKWDYAFLKRVMKRNSNCLFFSFGLFDLSLCFLSRNNGSRIEDAYKKISNHFGEKFNFFLLCWCGQKASFFFSKALQKVKWAFCRLRFVFRFHFCRHHQIGCFSVGSSFILRLFWAL